MAVNLLKPVPYNKKLSASRGGAKSKLLAFTELFFFLLFAASASAALMLTNLILSGY